MEGILIPMFGTFMIFGIVAVSVWGSVQARKEANETLRRAIDGGQKLDSDTISSLSKPARSVASDLRGGIVLLFLGGGLVVAGLIASGAITGQGWDEDAGIGFFIAAAIVGAIGLGQFVAAVMRGGDKKKET